MASRSQFGRTADASSQAVPSVVDAETQTDAATAPSARLAEAAASLGGSAQSSKSAPSSPTKRAQQWADPNFDRDFPSIQAYKYFTQCPAHKLPLWVAHDDERGWICLVCNAQAQVGHVQSTKHVKNVLWSRENTSEYEAHLRSQGLYDLAFQNERI